MTLLSVESATRHFGGVRALDGVSLRVDGGEVVGLIGPNGAGKSTLVNVVTGLYPLQTGRIKLAGRDVSSMPPHRRTRAGLVRTFQNVRLFPGLTVLENLVAVAANGSSRPRPSRAEQRARIQYVTERFQLGSWISRDVTAVPLGVQRRVELARATLLDASILLLDEPTSGIPGEEALELANVIRQLADDGLGVLLIEHNMAVVMPVSERVIVLHFGQVLAEGTPQQVQSDPRVVTAYLGEDNHDDAA